MDRPRETIPQTLLDIAAEHGIELFEDTVNGCDNRSWTDCSTIGLGQYEDEELLVISFFHELGHCRAEMPPYEEWEYHHYNETVAWRIGLQLAKRHGFAFSEKALRWAQEELGTYFENNHPERSPLRFLPTALIEARLLSIYWRSDFEEARL